MRCRFIQVTDTHLVPRGELLYGIDPLQRLRSCVDSIVTHHAGVDFVVVTGDLIHRGAVEAYSSLRDELARLPMPVHLMLGNHDHRPSFFEAFPRAPRDAHGFAQEAFDCAAGRCILLDTHVDEGSWGRLCKDRLAWLDNQLKSTGDVPVLLFCHHPPFPVGIPRMDQIALKDPEEFLATIYPHRHRIRHLFLGHIHRPICGSWHAIPFSALRGTNFQVALNFCPSDSIAGCCEPPSYAIATVDETSVIVHFHDFLDNTATFNLARSPYA